MHVLAIFLTMLTCAVAVVWTSRHLLIWRERRENLLLTEDYPGPPSDPPHVSVVVAAKDEADNIETCVRTMLRQDYPNFELIVANDRSTDATPAIVEGIAAEDNRVRLINVNELPAGWYGKSNAMQTAIDASYGEWICMIDADCRQTSPRTLSVAVQYAIDCGADLLSVLPVLEMRSFWENVVQPVCGGVMMIWFNPKRVNDPRRPQAYANGAFMLMKRQAYEAIGTHQAVKTEFNEDMHMAALTKRAGLKLRVVRNHGLYVVRMYTSLRKILQGWSRIFLGTFGTLRRLTVSLVLLAIMGLLPYGSVVVGFALAGAGIGPAAWWLACGIAGVGAVGLQLSVIYRFYKLAGARCDLAWSYLLACLVVMAALVTSIMKLRPGAKVVWKDTSYAPTSKKS